MSFDVADRSMGMSRQEHPAELAHNQTATAEAQKMTMLWIETFIPASPMRILRMKCPEIQKSDRGGARESRMPANARTCLAKGRIRFHAEFTVYALPNSSARYREHHLDAPVLLPGVDQLTLLPTEHEREVQCTSAPGQDERGLMLPA